MREIASGLVIVIAVVIAGCGGNQVHADVVADVVADVAVADVIMDTVVPDSTFRDVIGADLPGDTPEVGQDVTSDLLVADIVPTDGLVADAVIDVVPDAVRDASGPACPGIETPVVLGVLDETPLNEVSGLVASRAHPGILWGHNDSGDTPRIFAIQVPESGAGEGVPLAAVEFTVNHEMTGWEALGIDWTKVATDWEDIAIGPFAGFPGDSIFVADTGDNGFENPETRREFLRVFVMPEPVDIVAGDISTVRYFNIVYDDSPHDSEAFFVDPLTGDMYIVEKKHVGKTAGVYRILAGAMSGAADGTKLTASLVATIDVALATAADMSPDGLMLAIRNYGGAPDGVDNNGLFFFRTEGMTVEQMLAGTPCMLPNFPGDPAFEIQGETITFKPDNSGFYTAPERVFGPQELSFWAFAL